MCCEVCTLRFCHYVGRIVFLPPFRGSIRHAVANPNIFVEFEMLDSIYLCRIEQHDPAYKGSYAGFQMQNTQRARCLAYMVSH